MLMKRKLGAAIIATIVIIILILLFRSKGDDGGERIKVEVEKGKFEVTVTTTGELLAKNSEDIKGPEGMRRAGIWRVEIADLVAEGTIVKEGDFIAELDRTEIETKIQDLSAELQKIESQYVQTKLDTTLDLREARDNLVNLKYAMEESKITLMQSKYEPPATIRQANINVDKANRAFTQAKENYTYKVKQAKAKIREVGATLAQMQSKFDHMDQLHSKFIIEAPKPGMVIYIRDWDGKKKEVGSQISTWDPAVATLPDLSVMISTTFINEVDIRKIKVDQSVRIGVDAFPERSFTGTVFKVANIGEQRPGTDAKVFEVGIEIIGSDSTLRPSMTTSNTIVTNTLEEVIFIPLEAVHTDDSITYVYKESGFRVVRQQVKLGVANENMTSIDGGLKEGDVVYLSLFENPEGYKMVLLKESSDEGKSSE